MRKIFAGGFWIIVATGLCGDHKMFVIFLSVVLPSFGLLFHLAEE
jgi:hypothetical protein